MRLSPVPTTSFVVLLLLFTSSYAKLTEAGTVIRAIQPSKHAKRGATIEGLLLARQSSCDPGFHACDATSCCANGQNCVPDGCCPVGQICTGQSDECTDPSLVLCPDKSGCCAADETCVTGSTGAPACESGGGGGGGGGSSGGSGGGTSGGSSGGLGSSGGSLGGGKGGLGLTATPNQVTVTALPTTTSPPLFGDSPTPSLAGSSPQTTSRIVGDAIRLSASSVNALGGLMFSGLIFAF